MIMEKEPWIEKIMNSINGMASVTPDEELLARIQQKVKDPKNVPSATVWLVAASIVLLVMLNITLLHNTSKNKKKDTTLYLENTFNQSNQLY